MKTTNQKLYAILTVDNQLKWVVSSDRHQARRIVPGEIKGVYDVVVATRPLEFREVKRQLRKKLAGTEGDW